MGYKTAGLRREVLGAIVTKGPIGLEAPKISRAYAASYSVKLRIIVSSQNKCESGLLRANWARTIAHYLRMEDGDSLLRTLVLLASRPLSWMRDRGHDAARLRYGIPNGGKRRRSQSKFHESTNYEMGRFRWALRMLRGDPFAFNELLFANI